MATRWLHADAQRNRLCKIDDYLYSQRCYIWFRRLTPSRCEVSSTDLRMPVLYEWFSSVLRLDRESGSRRIGSETTMSNAADGISMNIDTEDDLVDYGDSSLGTLPELTEGDVQVGAGAQPTPEQVIGQEGHSLPSPGTVNPSQAAGNQSNVPSLSPGSYARAAISGAYLDEIRKEQVSR
jgi:hypothetical protein